MLASDDEFLCGISKSHVEYYSSSSQSGNYACSTMIPTVRHPFVNARIDYYIHTLTHLVVNQQFARWAESALSHPFTHQGTSSCSVAMTLFDHKASLVLVMYLEMHVSS